MSNHFPSTSCYSYSVKQTSKCWIYKNKFYWKLRCYVAKVSKLISKENKWSCGRFQNNISFNVENIKQKTEPWQRKITWSFYGNVYVWVWCSLNLFACSRIPVLKEPILLLHILSRMTKTTTLFVRKVTSPNINKF